MSRRAFLFGLAVIAVLIFSLYRAKYGARDSAAEIVKLEQQIAEAQARNSALRIERTHHTRQAWLEAYARNELGMVPASPEQFVRPSDIEQRLAAQAEAADE